MLSNGLPWLSVAGREIVAAGSQQPLRLRGVNRSGLEYADPSARSSFGRLRMALSEVEGSGSPRAPSRGEPGARGFLESAGISEREISHVVQDWGANIIRLPFNQDWALNGRGRVSAEAYLEAIDRVILWASRAGAYTLLDLQWLDADLARGLNPDGSCNRVPSLPTADSIVVWSILAHRYRAEPAVLFDLFNEPHDPIRGDPSVLEGIREDGTTFPLTRARVTMAEWQPWARHLVRAIRRAHPRSLIFVSGVGWAYDLRGMPLTIAKGSSETFPNIVYSTHVYPWGGTAAGSRRALSFAPHAALSWREAFGRLSRSAPVFVSEWGGGTQHVEWGETLVRYLRRLGIGWTAWSWSDRPRLVVDAQSQRYDPTDFGRIVRRCLLPADLHHQPRGGAQVMHEAEADRGIRCESTGGTQLADAQPER